jgi:hypothetical protein
MSEEQTKRAMPIDYNCPACGRSIAAEVRSGDELRCPSCDQVVPVLEAGAAHPSAIPTLDYACRRKGRRLGVGGILAVAIGIVLIMQLFAARSSGSPDRTICGANMMHVGNALRMYAEADPDGMFPEAGADWTARLLNANLIGPRQLKCPSDKSAARCSYIYVPGHSLTSDSASVLLYEMAGVHGKGGRIAFVNKRSTYLESPEYDRLINTINSSNGSAAGR